MQCRRELRVARGVSLGFELLRLQACLESLEALGVVGAALELRRDALLRLDQLLLGFRELATHRRDALSLRFRESFHHAVFRALAAFGTRWR